MANPLMLADLFTIYHKPSLGGQIILRRPRSRQTSERVHAQQANFAKRLEGNKIATQCKGKKARAFYGCLRTKGAEAYASGRSK